MRPIYRLSSGRLWDTAHTTENAGHRIVTSASFGAEVVQFSETVAKVAAVAMEERVQGFDGDGAFRRVQLAGDVLQ